MQKQRRTKPFVGHHFYHPQKHSRHFCPKRKTANFESIKFIFVDRLKFFFLPQTRVFVKKAANFGAKNYLYFFFARRKLLFGKIFSTGSQRFLFLSLYKWSCSLIEKQSYLILDSWSSLVVIVNPTKFLINRFFAW